MHLRIRDQDVVLSVRIRRIHSERVVAADELRVDRAELAVLPREAVHPVPLLPHCLHLGRVLRHIDESRPDDQAGGQHRGDPHRGQDKQPPFELLVLGFVMRTCACAVAVAEHRPRHEQIDADEDDAGNPERDADRVVDRAPVGGNRREVPRTEEVKQDGRRDQQNQCDCDAHGHILVDGTLARRSRPSVGPASAHSQSNGSCRPRPPSRPGYTRKYRHGYFQFAAGALRAHMPIARASRETSPSTRRSGDPGFTQRTSIPMNQSW